MTYFDDQVQNMAEAADAGVRTRRTFEHRFQRCDHCIVVCSIVRRLSEDLHTVSMGAQHIRWDTYLVGDPKAVEALVELLSEVFASMGLVEASRTVAPLKVEPSAQARRAGGPEDMGATWPWVTAA